MNEKVAVDQIRWSQVNGEPFEYAIQQGPHGDEFVKLLDGSCLRRALAPLRAREEIARALYKSRMGLNDKQISDYFADYAKDPRGYDYTRISVFAAYRDADAVLALSRTAGQEWRDISSAPKEPRTEYAYGPTILLWVDGTVGVGFWDYDFRKFYVEYPEDGTQPTHWMPLPASPVAEPLLAEQRDVKP